MVSLFLLKAVLCSITLATNTISAFVTFCVCSRVNKNASSSREQSRLALANCFSIGLFLSVCFLGLYHSSSIKLRMVQDLLHTAHFLKSYPISEATLCFGLFILWLLEWTIRSIIERFPSSLSDDRSLSLSNTGSRLNEVDELGDFVLGDVLDDRINLLPTTQPAKLDVDPPNGPDRVERPDRRVYGGTPTKQLNSNFLRTVFLSSAMGIHSFLEALGYGLLDTAHQVYTMAFAMTLHQALCSGTLGLRLARVSTTSTHRKAVILLIFYLLLVPFGAFIGFAIHSTHPVPVVPYGVSPTSCANSTTPCLPVQILPPLGHSVARQVIMALLQNLAAATFLYVVFVEMLPAEVNAGMPCSYDRRIRLKQKTTASRGVLCCLSGMFGFLLIAGLHLIPHG
ncbi:Zinc transporter ZIP3 [Clonorchis sinensis]|uniref:Zinc transporter ZIP3 n=2 Tax=Clonorchis sinensis TaxID=79923 RepID=A0A8T1MUE6_CLOSI|nr:Zinc transporter ZIP3 [Clonorchis sinensis]